MKALPPESPLDMPRHGLFEAGLPLKNRKLNVVYLLSTFFSRMFVLILTSALAYYGISEIHSVIAASGITNLQWLFLALFSINFVWISYAFAQATLGFLVSIIPLKIRHKEKDPAFKTAILMPVYNEDPTHISMAIKAMRDELVSKAPEKFAFFILSDTNHAENWINEESEFMAVTTHDADCPVYYRRRTENTERKAGNIADWVQRWGGDYEAMVILDADSLISADCFITLARRLAASPEVGLIQTLPTIIRAKTLYGRLQQFANHCYGPIYARGLSAWHGLSSNFWGHNAIIRTKAFAESCSLPILPGKPPFGGHVLSHDFIEAALLRRAGWGVRFDTDIEHTYEEAPPSLVDVLIRDRRWCQGNLQHFPFLFAQGFVLPTRLHIFSGIMSYLSAVFWLMLIMVGLAIAVQAAFVRPEYFANPSLFPTWPVFDAERALNLFYISMALVLAPKVFGWFSALVNVKRCLTFGGPILLSMSVITEVLLSALYAPVLMVSQFGVVYSILRGKDSGWRPQARDDGALSWSTLTRTHLGHTVFGLFLAGISYVLSLELFYWLLPISAGLLLSIPLSWLSGGYKRSRWLSSLGFLRSPQEKSRQSAIVMRLNQCLENYQNDSSEFALEHFLVNKDLCKWHIAQLDKLPDRTVFHSASVTGEWKINHAKSFEHLQSMLEQDELKAILALPHCLDRIKERFA